MTRQFGVSGGILAVVAVTSLSPSSASTFEQCPLRWRFRYIDRLPDPPGPDAVVGTFAHLVFEHLLELNPADRTPDRARTLAGQLVDSTRTSDDYQRTWAGADREFDWRSWWAIRGLWRLERPDQVDVVATEQRLRLQLGAVPFVGVLDRLNGAPGGVEVVDYKGLALDTPLPTPSGWTTMGDVQVGDQVLGANGSPVTVVAKSPIFARPCYRLSFVDGSSVVCDNVHEWVVRRHNWVRARAVNADELAALSSSRHRCYVSPPAPVDLPERDLAIPPYLLGLWLGDGNCHKGSITVGAQDLQATLRELAARGFPNCTANADGSRFQVTVHRPVADACQRGHRGARGAKRCVGCCERGPRTNLALLSMLRAAGLLCRAGEKRIPAEYLRCSIAQRMELLRGLMDSDGSWNPLRRQAVFVTTTKALADGVAELVALMGWRHATWTDGHQWRIQFRPTAPYNPFSLQRKASVVRFAGASEGPDQSRNRTITKVEAVPSVPTQCITVDAADSLYLCGERMVPTHNCGKPPRNAAQRGEKLRQLLHYAGAAETLGWRVVRVRLLYVAHGVTVGKVVTWGDITEAHEHLEATWAALNEAVDADLYPARTSPLCGWCPYVPHCPAGQAEVERRLKAGKAVGPAYSESPVSIGAAA